MTNRATNSRAGKAMMACDVAADAADNGSLDATGVCHTGSCAQRQRDR
jgi:hypothetical protein